MALWLVLGRSYGEHEAKFIDENKVCLTWGEFTATDMTGIADYDGIRQRVSQSSPNEPVRKLGNWSGQVWAFVLGMNVGDWVVNFAPAEQYILPNNLFGQRGLVAPVHRILLAHSPSLMLALTCKTDKLTFCPWSLGGGGRESFGHWRYRRSRC